jgi:hypothetical protein
MSEHPRRSPLTRHPGEAARSRRVFARPVRLAGVLLAVAMTGGLPATGAGFSGFLKRSRPDR